MALTRPRASQINTVITNVTDPLIVLNNGSTVANIDIGLIMNRNNGTLPNVALFWDESANTFVTSFTTSTGGTNANVTISEYANVKAGTFFGNLGGGSTLANIYITGSLIPTANVTYDLGTPTQRFRDGYFSGNTIFIGSERMSVDSNGKWSFTSGGATVNLGHQEEFNPPNISASGNVKASNFNFANGVSIITTLTSAIDNANTGLKGYVDGQVSTLTANAGAQAGSIATIFANLGSVSGSLATLTSNAAAQAGDIATLYANAGAQSGQIITANTAMKGYVDGQISTTASSITTANSAMKGYVDGQISTTASSITTANSAMKGYVDGQITSLVNGAPSTLDTLNELASALGNDANLSVTLTSYIGNVNSNIATANTAMKGYVDGQITTLSSNSASLTGDIASIYANLGAVSGSLATLTANAGAQSGSIATLTANAAVQAGDIATIYANLGSVSGSLATLTANAATQAGQISAVQANVVPISGAADQIIYRNSSNVITGSSNLRYDGVSIKVNGNLESIYTNGDEGGEIFLEKPQTNTTLAAGVTIDIFQNRLRIFENGGTYRGGYFEITSLSAGVGSNLALGGGGGGSNYGNTEVASYLSSINNAVLSDVTTANTAMKGYVDGINSTLTANAGAQAGSIATLTSNAAVQAGDIATIYANLGSVSGSLATLTSNAGAQAGSIATLTSNAAVQAGDIATLTSNAAAQAGSISDLYTIKANLSNPTFTNNVSVLGNLIISGNLITTNVDNLQIDDSLIYMAENNATDFLDIGIIGSFTKNSLYQHTGIVRDATDGIWKVFANVQAEPTTTVDFGSATYSPIQAGNIIATGNVVVGANLRLTGALLNSAGSAGTSGQYLSTTGSGVAWTSIDFSTATDGGTSSVDVNGGYVNVTASGTQVGTFTSSGVSLVGNVLVPTYGGAFNNLLTFRSSTADDNTEIQVAPSGSGVASSITVLNNADATNAGYLTMVATSSYTQIDSSTHGSGTRLPLSFRVGGQWRVEIDTGGNVAMARNGANNYSNVNIAHTTPSTSTTTGALQVSGGAGIAGNVNAGNVTATNLTGTLLTASQTNITGLGTVTTGTWNAGAVTSSGLITANTATGRVQLGTDAGGSISIGPNINSATTPYIDFNTSATNVDYDVRIQASGNVGTVARGNLTITAGNIVMTSADTFVNRLFVNSGNNVTAIVNSGTAGVGNIGASGAGFNTVFARATSAQYADLAEVYTSDREYVPGTVLIFGGEREVTVSTLSHDPRVAGVVSTNPAYIMNNSCDGVEVALQGRVPTKVQGPVAKGDRLVTSSVQGAAERLDMSKYQPGCIIGKALEDIADDSIQTIEVVVGRV